MNALDKAIGYVMPGVALKRAEARQAIEKALAPAPQTVEQSAPQVSLNGYSSAAMDRAAMQLYITQQRSADSDIVFSLPTLRAQSRDLVRTSPVALGTIDTMVQHAIGTGLTFTPSIEKDLLGMDDEQAEEWQQDVKFRFDTWAQSPCVDIAERVNFYEMQALARRTQGESGDALVLTPLIRDSNGRMQLALQLIEADRICNKDQAANTQELVEGVALDPVTGRHKGYWIAQRHPGALMANGSNQWDYREAYSAQGRRNALHLIDLLRPGQTRGVPMLAPVIVTIKQLQRFTEAELDAAVVAGLNALFATMDAQAFQEIYDDQSKEQMISSALGVTNPLESAQITRLLPGEKIESPTPGRPNPEFQPFFDAMMTFIGMAVGVPPELLLKKFSSSYIAGRAAMLIGYKAFTAMRIKTANQFCAPVYQLWLENEILEGRVAAPGFFADPLVRAAWCRSIWGGDAMVSLDPQREVQAAKMRVDMEISTLQNESIAFDGIDWQQKHEQRTKEVNAQKEDGTFIAPAGSPAAGPMEDGQPAKGKDPQKDA
jgi:lambda family phage portal protein